MKLIFNIIILFIFTQLSAQSIFKESLSEPTSYSDIINYLQETTRLSNIFELGWIGKSHEGRSIPFVKVSSTGFRNDSNKVIFMIFAQQHGNEPAGKEALLSLLEDFKDKKLDYLLDKIDFLIIPQLNPDAAEIGKRIGSSGIDLNRSHVTLSSEEVFALHELFYRCLPDVTLDLHEYFPYKKEWKKLGARKNFDVTLGLLTNPNIAKELIDISNNEVLPFVRQFVENKGYSFGEYTLGIVPNNEPVRFSNLGIYDGRQSFGILNTLSFIVEGKNGEQVNTNLNNRREYEKTSTLALSNFIYKNCKKIKNIVKEAREKLFNSKEGEILSIRTKHGPGKNSYAMKLLSITTGKDTIVNFPFDSEVISSLNVAKPLGYLIDKNDSTLLSFIVKNHIKAETNFPKNSFRIIQYKTKFETIDRSKDNLEQLERSENNIPHFESEDVTERISARHYLFVPMNQISSNFIVLTFEPQSFQSIFLDKKFDFLLDQNGYFKILRLETMFKKQN